MIRLFFGRPGEGMSYSQGLSASLPGDKPGTRMEALRRLCGAGGMGVQTPHVALRATRAPRHVDGPECPPEPFRPQNVAAWLAIASFLDAKPWRDLYVHGRKVGMRAARCAEGAPLAGEASAHAAGPQALPVGNHGDNDLQQASPSVLVQKGFV